MTANYQDLFMARQAARVLAGRGASLSGKFERTLYRDKDEATLYEIGDALMQLERIAQAAGVTLDEAREFAERQHRDWADTKAKASAKEKPERLPSAA